MTEEETRRLNKNSRVVAMIMLCVESLPDDERIDAIQAAFMCELQSHLQRRLTVPDTSGPPNRGIGEP